MRMQTKVSNNAGCSRVAKVIIPARAGALAEGKPHEQKPESVTEAVPIALYRR